MKYNELDLTAFLPDGQPLNEADRVESKGYINAFFLRAFEWWYEKKAHYAISYAAPYSLDACMACTQAELQRFIEEGGQPFYSGNSIETNARFAHAIYTQQVGTSGRVDSVVKYILNNSDVSGRVSYDGLPPHYYNIIASGDLTASTLTPEVMSRIEALLNDLAPVTEKINGVVLEQTTNIELGITDIYCDSARFCEIELDIPERILYLFHTIDTVDGTESQLNNPPDLSEIDKGGTMFTSGRTLEDTELINNYQTVDKGGTIFNGAKSINIVQSQYGFGTVDKT